MLIMAPAFGHIRLLSNYLKIIFHFQNFSQSLYLTLIKLTLSFSLITLKVRSIVENIFYIFKFNLIILIDLSLFSLKIDVDILDLE